MNRLLILLFIFCFHHYLVAQQLTGKVLGENEKGIQENLPAANVYWLEQQPI